MCALNPRMFTTFVGFLSIIPSIYYASYSVPSVLFVSSLLAHESVPSSSLSSWVNRSTTTPSASCDHRVVQYNAVGAAANYWGIYMRLETHRRLCELKAGPIDRPTRT